MGKQDPYCAARLGKDAQKTPTDKRGGQTPKWDHELRFTVHDSPDYRQLKVSVFNDDKKTDLIGETWVALDEILVRGGGEREGWNSLNFKGRYAGEIWIELTYWDTRPREEKPPTPVSNSSSTLHHERSSDAVGGPRQLKPVKRRPLPADPTSNDSYPTRPTLPDHTQSAPLPYTPPRGVGRLHGPSPHSVNESARYHSHQVARPPQEEDHMPKSFSQPQLGQYDEPQFRSQDELHFEPSPVVHDTRSAPRDITYDHDLRSNYGYSDEPERADRAYHQSEYDELELPELPPHTPRNQRPAPHVSPGNYSQHDTHSSPVYTLPNYGPSPTATHSPLPERGMGSAPSSVRNDRYVNDHNRQESFDEYSQHASYPSIEDDGPPPPPPAHRSSGVGTNAWDQNQMPAHVAPLNARHVRGSVSASPLVHSFNGLPADEQLTSSPVETELSFRAGQMATYDVYDQPRRHSDRSFEMQRPPQAYGQHSPSYPAYDHTPEQQPYRGPPHQGSVGASPYSTPPNRGRPSPVADRRYAGPAESDEYWDERSQRSSAPIIKPRAVSPDPRTPMRKSVSPHPPPSSQGSLSGVPFSPDSYDQLNPNLKNAQSINTPGPKYNTPEGAREAAREREKEEQLAKGPIIDHRGNIVDPSDHLPTDTWAPEPERKVPRKSHQINIKFKHSPVGVQPMPPAAPRLPRENTRPYSMSGAPAPVQHAYASDDVSSQPGGRNRLQKKSRAPPASYNSSPVLPTAGHYQTPSPQSYPLREHPNYGHGSSPGYQRSSPMGGGGPPPVPAKVPLGYGQEDWGADRLSEEIRGIDIGMGSGGRRRENFRY